MVFLNILLLVVGFVLLVKGADWFVDGAAGIAGKLKIPELIIGLTIVAFGTSAPELSVSLTSVLSGSNGITMGNVLGSNVLNVALILGLSAVICTLPVQKSSLKLDFPVLIGASAALLLMIAFDNDLGRVDGIILVAALVAYIALLVFFALRDRKRALSLGEQIAEEEEDEPKGKIGLWYKSMCAKAWFLVIILLVGLALVVFGSNLVVDSAKFLAEKMGISERVIGLTVIALGTSLPELVTSVVAAKKKKTDIAVGNIIGSNIFNICCCAGITAIIRPIAVEPKIVIDAAIALGVALLLAVTAYLPGHKIRRWGGILLLTSFVCYYVYLFLV